MARNAISVMRAKMLRQQAIPAEQKLWAALRQLQKTHSYKFRRQYPIHPYIVDFACLSARLVVEADGISHDFSMQKDSVRDRYIASKGYKILRYSNDEISKNPEGVVADILNEIARINKPLT